jgi:hypothetical protein
MFNNGISKNLLLLNIFTSNVLRNNYDDDANTGDRDTFYGLYNKWGVDTPCIRPILECKTIGAQHSVCRRPDNIYCEGHNSSIGIAIEVHEYLIKTYLISFQMDLISP